MFLKIITVAIAVLAILIALFLTPQQGKTICLASNSEFLLDEWYQQISNSRYKPQDVTWHRLDSPHMDITDADRRAMGFSIRIPFYDPVCDHVLVAVSGSVLADGRNPLYHFREDIGNHLYLTHQSTTVVVVNAPCDLMMKQSAVFLPQNQKIDRSHMLNLCKDGQRDDVFQLFTSMHKVDVDLLSNDRERFFDWHESFGNRNGDGVEYDIRRLLRHLINHSPQ